MFNAAMNALLILVFLATMAPATGQTEPTTPCTSDTIGNVLGEEAIASRKLTRQLALFTNALRDGKALDPVQRVIWIAPTDCPVPGFDAVAIPIRPTEVTGNDGVKFLAPTYVIYVSENHLRWAGVANLTYSGREQACRIMRGKADDLERLAEHQNDPEVISCIFDAAQTAHTGNEKVYWDARTHPSTLEEWEDYSLRLGGVIGRLINNMRLELLSSSDTPDAPARREGERDK